MEISDSQITEAPPPRPLPPSAPPRRVVEKTLELSDSDLELPDAPPDGPEPQRATKAPTHEAELPPVEAQPSEAERDRQRKRERNKRKKRRQKQRKG